MKKLSASWGAAVVGIVFMLTLFISTSFAATTYNFDNSPYRQPVVDTDVSQRNSDLGGGDVDTDEEISAAVRVSKMKYVNVIIVEDNYGNQMTITNTSVTEVMSREPIDTNNDGIADDIPSYKSGDKITVYWARNGEKTKFSEYVIDTGKRNVKTPKPPVSDR